MAQAIGIVTTAGPMPHDATVTEARLVQPAVSVGLGALSGHLQFRGTLDLEGWTMPGGELTPGAYGEGYIDRRHPHTYAHELMLTAHDVLGRLGGPAHLSAAFGKGFVAFGSDDPMSRPVALYPIDHHLAQILEREVAIAGLAAGPAALEVSWFNGDEPEYPSEWPNGRRFGDSYALRGSVAPVRGVEAQVSYAEVKSPEHRDGAGPPQEKWSASVRVDRTFGGRPAYALAEYARTSEASGAFLFHSLVLEGAVQAGPVHPYLRLERTERPEEARTGDVFRTPRPPLDNSLLGITRWSVATAGASVTALTAGPRFSVRPFLEASVADVRAISGTFDVRAWYGSNTILSLSLGVRLDWGMAGHRMGRYGTGIAAGGDGMEMPMMEGP
ncbi:MAG TPA: hypothetical protein VFU45_07580, partial [Gemmatimonadales bacterium]|nr:hypothetical protein [Gemmatimonadales bacterium]